MLRKVCFIAVFAASSSAAVSAVSALPKVCFAVSSSAAASALSKVCFVAVFAASSSAAASLLSKVFAVSSSAAASSSFSKVCFLVAVFAASSLSKVCFVAVFAGPLSAAASSSSTASTASLALGKNRATILAGWRTIVVLSKSTSFCCKTIYILCFFIPSAAIFPLISTCFH